MRDYMDRPVTPPKLVTSPTWGPPPPCKQALRKTSCVFIFWEKSIKIIVIALDFFPKSTLSHWLLEDHMTSNKYYWDCPKINFSVTPWLFPNKDELSHLLEPRPSSTLWAFAAIHPRIFHLLISHNTPCWPCFFRVGEGRGGGGASWEMRR